MDDQEREQEIESRLNSGWQVEEITRYAIYDSEGRFQGEGSDEYDAWEDVLTREHIEAVRFAKQRLAKWNSAVAGKQS